MFKYIRNAEIISISEPFSKLSHKLKMNRKARTHLTLLCSTISSLSCIKAAFSLDVKYLDDYKKEFKSVNNFDEFFMMLNRFVEKHYSWSYTNGITETKADQKAATSVFDIRLIEAERTSEEVRRETKREIETVTKDSEHAAELDALKKSVSDDLKGILSDSITKLSDLFENEDNEIGLKKLAYV